MLGQSWFVKDYVWKVGDRVCHCKDETLVGTIKEVEDNGLSVMVSWDDPVIWTDEALDFQWANKLRKISNG